MEITDIATNRKARHEYQILDTYEAGLVLTGTEVKSLRAGRATIGDAFARVEKGEVWLYNCDIQPYDHGNINNHVPKRVRKLLLRKVEIRKLFGLVSVKGNALVALRLYFKDGYAKLELGVGRGKTAGDKRQDVKKRDDRREVERELAHRRKGK